MLELNKYRSRILHDLKEINCGPLPTRGFIAGSAVANLILSYVWGGNYSVGSIDVLFDEINPFSRYVWSGKYPVRSIELFVEEVTPQPDASLSPLRISGYFINDTYRPTLSKIGYKAININRKGIINHVLIRKTEPVFGDDQKRCMLLLNGFTLNCNMVGIDALSGKVFWTNAFERFLHDGQLQVTCPVTPYQTTIQLPQLRQDLGCYVNLRDEIGLLASYEKACRMDELYDSYVGSFSANSLQLFQTHQETLSPFCQLIEFTPPVLPGLEAWMDSRFALDYNVELLNNEQVDSLLSKAEGFDSYSFTLAYNYIVRSSPRKCRNRFIIGVSWGGIPALDIMLNPASVHSDLQKKHLACIELFSRKHPACMKQLMKMNMTIQDQYKAIRLMQKLSNKKGDIIFGLIENSQHLGVSVSEISEAVLTSLLEAFMAVEGESLVEPVDLEDYKHKASVAEITTAAGLKMESSIMRHCIQTYSAAVKKRICRVFHIYKNGRHSTAAIYPECEFEIHGPRNSDPPHEHVEIADSLSRVLWKCFEQGGNLVADLNADDYQLDSNLGTN